MAKTKIPKRESLANRSARAKKILGLLRKQYPDANCALDHENAFELLIATILSAQSTDETVNKVLPTLFNQYPTPKALGTAKVADVETVIRSTGFFRQKAKNIVGAARKIEDEFGGEVPQAMEDLLTLPGVARKTANVVLGTWFEINEGVVVDTHVGRIAERLRITWNARNSKDAVKIERDLMQVIPQKSWTYLSHALILHGRQICNARKPNCPACTLAGACPYPDEQD